MDTTRLNEYLQQALDMFDSGHDYSRIRKALEQKDVGKEEIDYIIRLVDDFALEARKIKENKRWSVKKIIYGVLFLIVALIKAFMFNNLGYLYTSYGLLVAIPLAIGLYLIWNGYFSLRKWRSYEPEIDDTKLKLTRRIQRP